MYLNMLKKDILILELLNEDLQIYLTLRIIPAETERFAGSLCRPLYNLQKETQNVSLASE